MTLRAAAAELADRDRRDGVGRAGSRGDHLVEADLLTALAQGRIEGATLDVASVEPLPAAHAFWAHPGILITPHIAGITMPSTAAARIAENARRAMRGQTLQTLVEGERGY